MEYSVNDLIRILLKKWYVILLAMCLLGGLSAITVRKSYEKALADYEKYTTETVSIGVETGTLVASYQCGYEVSDVVKAAFQDDTKSDFWQIFVNNIQLDVLDEGEKNDVYAWAEQAFSAASEDFPKLLADALAERLLTDPLVISGTQEAVKALKYQEPPTIDASGVVHPSAGPLNVSNHFTVEILNDNTLRMTVIGLEEEAAQKIIAAYLNCLASTGKQGYALVVTATPLSASFSPDPVFYTTTAQFAQTVMQKPEQASLVKTVGTAAAFAFVLACFLVLLFTFVKDSRAAAKKNRV